jgi:carboxyl-terminal processing protease
MRSLKSLLALSCLALLTCAAAPAQSLSEPERNFEALWKTFDEKYSHFGVKNIDWQVVYRIYRPKVTPKTTDGELFDVLASMIAHLNDNHVGLRSPSRRFGAGILQELRMEDFSLDLVKETYLKGKALPLHDGVFHYGWLTDTIGYFHFRGFGNVDESGAAVDTILKEFGNARALVVDVRGNGGGDDRVGRAIASRFADRKRLYMTVALRNGPKHDDFAAPVEWFVEPAGPMPFTKPVVLVTHRFSVSAAENFALAMRTLPHVIQAGDLTSGAFADTAPHTLPNGWRFSVPFNLFRDRDGFCWEGIGIPPDYRQLNSKADVDAKRDRVLELAIALIESGAKPAPGSRTSAQK